MIKRVEGKRQTLTNDKEIVILDIPEGEQVLLHTLNLSSTIGSLSLSMKENGITKITYYSESSEPLKTAIKPLLKLSGKVTAVLKADSEAELILEVQAYYV